MTIIQYMVKHTFAESSDARPGFALRAFVAALALTCTFVGCSKSDSSSTETTAQEANHASNIVASLPPVPAGPQYLTKLKNAFASADPGMRLNVDETIGFIQGRDFAEATAGLQRLSNNPNLTPEQKQAVSEALAQIQGMGSR